MTSDLDDIVRAILRARSSPTSSMTRGELPRFRCGNDRGTLEEQEERRQRFLPCPLPQPRPRALTLPLANVARLAIPSNTEENSEVFRQAQAQTLSLFLTKLPLEVRLLVYNNVLCWDTLHIVHLDGRLYSVPCLDEQIRSIIRHITLLRWENLIPLGMVALL
jgi:hypothetical protein